jgi:hypothetical protein
VSIQLFLLLNVAVVPFLLLDACYSTRSPHKKPHVVDQLLGYLVTMVASLLFLTSRELFKVVWRVVSCRVPVWQLLAV